MWHGPFGGTFSAGGTFATDYSYRGISQTQRQVAFQPFLTYETPSVASELASVSGLCRRLGQQRLLPRHQHRRRGRYHRRRPRQGDG